MVRTPFYDKNGLKKGAWSTEEDNKLRAYIQKSGHPNWRKLPKSAGLSRCGKSCRLRWMNYLRPNVKLGNYTEEEDLKITKLHDELGNKWSMIATRLPGRTDNDIKNHWHTHLKNRTKKISRKSKVLKEQAAGIMEAENDICSDPSYQILESSDNKPVSGVEWVAEDCLLTLETLEQSFENFWTEPFFMEDTYIQTKYPASLAQGGFSTSPSRFNDNDGIDLIHQVMQELPEN